jgi:hypothetical protein
MLPTVFLPFCALMKDTPHVPFADAYVVWGVVLFQLSSVGAGGEIRRFEKPWFTTFESALACWFSLFLFALSTWVRRQPSGTTVGSSTHREPLMQVSLLFPSLTVLSYVFYCG